VADLASRCVYNIFRKVGAATCNWEGEPFRQACRGRRTAYSSLPGELH